MDGEGFVLMSGVSAAPEHPRDFRRVRESIPSVVASNHREEISDSALTVSAGLSQEAGGGWDARVGSKIDEGEA